MVSVNKFDVSSAVIYKELTNIDSIKVLLLKLQKKLYQIRGHLLLYASYFANIHYSLTEYISTKNDY